VEFPPWSDQDFRRVEDCLHHAAHVAQSDWLSVLAEAGSGNRRPPCDSCGYLGKGCPGVSPEGGP
jgi:hypothetical protein